MSGGHIKTGEAYALILFALVFAYLFGAMWAQAGASPWCEAQGGTVETHWTLDVECVMPQDDQP